MCENETICIYLCNKLQSRIDSTSDFILRPFRFCWALVTWSNYVEIRSDHIRLYNVNDMCA